MKRFLLLFAAGAALASATATHTVYLNSVSGVTPCVVTGSQPQAPGGGSCTDSSSAIQAIVNTASSSNPLVLVVEDGYEACISIPNGATGGNITIRGLGWNTGFIAPKNANCSVINNGYGYSPGTASTASANITIENLVINGFAGANCGSAPCNANSSGGDNRGNGTWLQPIQLYNVNNVVIRHVLTLHPPTFAIVIGNASNVVVRDSYIANAGGGQQNTDGIHFQGPNSNIELANDTLDTTGDDSICLCAPEAMGGNISNTFIHNITLVNAYDVMRIYMDCSTLPGCASGGPWTVSKTVVRDVVGVVSAWAFNLSGDPVGTTYTTDQNDSLFISNVNISPTLTSATDSWLKIWGNWGEVTCEYCIWTAPTQTAPMFTVLGNISHLNLVHDRIFRNSTAAQVQDLVKLNTAVSATVKRLTISDFEVVDSLTGTYSAIPAILDAQSGSSVGMLEVQNTLNSTGQITALFTSGTSAQVTKVAGDISGFPMTIASLPAAATGLKAIVTNAQTSPAFLGTVSTTGSVTAPVFYNGSGWVYY